MSEPHRVREETIRPGEARYDTAEHQHHWIQGNNIWGELFAECLCGASAEWVEVTDAETD